MKGGKAHPKTFAEHLIPGDILNRNLLKPGRNDLGGGGGSPSRELQLLIY